MDGEVYMVLQQHRFSIIFNCFKSKIPGDFLFCKFSK